VLAQEMTEEGSDYLSRDLIDQLFVLKLLADSIDELKEVPAE